MNFFGIPYETPKTQKEQRENNMFDRPSRTKAAIHNIKACTNFLTFEELTQFKAILDDRTYSAQRDYVAENRFIMELEQRVLKRASEAQGRPSHAL